jgi:hypothetical protein
MGSLDNALLKDCSPPINVSLLTDMCKQAFNKVDSNLAISAFIPDPVNLSLMFRSYNILVPNNVAAIAPPETNVAPSSLTPVGYDVTNVTFDINRFLAGFSTNNNIADRMHDVRVSLTENKAITMGVTFVNRARGFLESVLVTNRHGDAKTLPYRSAIGLVSRKSRSAVSGTTKRGEEDEESDDERGEKKVKRKDVPEMPRKTGRTANDVVELLEFSGKEGHGVVTNVVETYLDCHEIASFVHCPILHLDEVKVTTHTLLCFTNIPYRPEMRCKKHPYGCGSSSLKVGDLVRVHAVEKCHLIKGTAWFIPVFTISLSGMLGCCVGMAKTLPTQAHIVANRTALVSKLCDMEERTEANKKSQSLPLLCAYAEAKFVDTLNVLSSDKQDTAGI